MPYGKCKGKGKGIALI